LLGRHHECLALDTLLGEVRRGQSAAILVHGDAGIGKSALLRYVRRQATEFQIARAAGVESELELAFGGLHQLCLPFLDRTEGLPAPQREALGTAFGLTAGTPPDRFLVGLAVLSLLAEVAHERPLLCVIDDAQWLDGVTAQTLAFVARRLLAEQVALVFAMRHPVDGHPLHGLPNLEVQGLAHDDARALLDSVAPGPLDQRIRERILAETRGNPLAILELPRGMTPGESGGGFGTPDSRPLSGQMEEGFLRRIQALPADTQRLLCVAAAEPVGDVTLLRSAAERLGLDVDRAAVPAQAEELITLGIWVRFRHPLVRSAAYRAGTERERQDAHRVLAEATDAQVDPDRRAWHLARAAKGPDESVAAELERSAGRAQARGGVAAAAALLDQSAQLTPDRGRRGTRALAAAQAKYRAGAFAEALELLEAAELNLLDELARARATRLRGRIMCASGSASAGLPVLLEAAKRLESLDSRLAGATYRDAIYVAFAAGRSPGETGVMEVATAALAKAPTPNPTRSDLLLDGVAQLTTAGYAAGVPLLQQALTAFRTGEVSTVEALGWLPLAVKIAHDVWDFESYCVLSAKLVELARATGAVAVLPTALLLRATNQLFVGDLDGMASLAAEAAAIGEASGSTFFANYTALVTEPWRGNEAATRKVIDLINREMVQRWEGKDLAATEWAAAVLYNGLGRYDEAYLAAKRGSTYWPEMGVSTWSMVELVEAATRLGKPEDAREVVERVCAMARAAGTDWALGTGAYVTAQVSDGPVADGLYQDAIARLERTGIPWQIGRVRLLYGEWLRRDNRRADAREQLSRAYETLSGLGLAAFAERARRELEAAGASAPKRLAQAGAELSPQEAQIARLAGEGLTNPEIGAQLFLSPHTVEWHLRKVFAKLGVKNRRQLAAIVGGASARV
jgi:DNA-binding CsgD family transcriptional regulator